MSRSGEGLRRVEEEIAREKAAALGRAGERLEQALREASGIAAVLAATPAAERAPLVAAYEEARRRAAEARLALVIQREALGLRRHAVVDECYPEPPEWPRPGADTAGAARPGARPRRGGDTPRERP